MTDKEEAADVDVDHQRKLFQKQVKAVGRFSRAIQLMKDKETTTSVSLIAISDKVAEMATIVRRANRSLDLIFDNEEDEDKLDLDEREKADFQAEVQAAANTLHDMSSLKKAAALSQLLEKDIRHVEGLLVADDSKDCSAFMPDVQRHLDIFSSLLVESTIDPGNEIWGIRDTIQERLLNIKAQMKVAPPGSTTTTIIKSEKDRDFDTPKVNIPKFKGGLEAWSVFWGRYKAAVHENSKLREAVKMAILLDLMEDPSLKKYLQAQSDGQEGRYAQTISYLQHRFDRPRELHQVYCKQLIDIPAIKGTPEELSRTADSVFAAVEGIRRGGQDSINYLATSLVVAVLPTSLRLQWETKTEEDPKVPHVDKFIDFLRQKATNASQAQKATSNPAPLQREKKKQPGKADSKVYTSHGDPVRSGEMEESMPSKFRSKQYKNQSNSPKIQCSLCSAAHFVF